jgi:hypothetical protein
MDPPAPLVLPKKAQENNVMRTRGRPPRVFFYNVHVIQWALVLGLCQSTG